jgi:hypothetical protein
MTNWVAGYGIGYTVFTEYYNKLSLYIEVAIYLYLQS